MQAISVNVRRRPHGARKGLVVLVLCLTLGILNSYLFQPGANASDSGTATMSVTFGAEGFLENVGQLADERIRFYSTGTPTIGFGKSAVYLVFTAFRGSEVPSSSSGGDSAIEDAKGVMVRISFGDSRAVWPNGAEPLARLAHFFKGSDPASWHRHVQSYGEVVFQDIYSGVDAAYIMTPLGLKSEYRIRAGADPGRIQISYEGVESLTIRGGELVAEAGSGEIRESRPEAYQDGKSVPCRFELRGARNAGFRCSGWDPSRSWIIDPLVFGTFLGGGMGAEDGLAVAVDDGGNAFVAGMTRSAQFPSTPGPFDADLNGTQDAFVAKLNAGGDDLFYATYLGGSGIEYANSVAIDAAGRAYVGGETDSSDFPLVGAMDDALNGTDGFLAVFSPTGDELEFSTFIGGTAADAITAIALGSDGSVYATGYTLSPDFPTTSGAWDRAINGSTDAFALRLDLSTRLYLFSTYLGGRSVDNATAIEVDDSGRAVVVGWTGSDDFPIRNPADSLLSGGTEGFLSALDATGGLLGSTYLGGSQGDQALDVTLGGTGEAFVVGSTLSSDFPAALNSIGGGVGSDVFVTRTSGWGSAILWSRYVGGQGVDHAGGVAFWAGEISLTGVTFSPDFPISADAEDSTLNGTGDVFFVRLAGTGTVVIYATYFGGAGYDQGQAIAVDSAGSAYVTGNTASDDFPVTPGAFDTLPPQGADGFVLKWRPAVPPALPDAALGAGDLTFEPPSPVGQGTSVYLNASVHNLGGAAATNLVVRFHDGPPPTNRIGSDQLVSFLPGGATTIVTVVWNATPVGNHTICAVADPDSVILEENETNNETCAPLEVLPPVLPNLVVTSSDLSVAPPSPVLEGSVVTVNATIRNAGSDMTGTAIARFHDGVPPGSPIGGDRSFGPILGGGTAFVSTTWTAGPAGAHDLCVAVDPDDFVAESSESDNVACLGVFVQAAPELRPDYVPSDGVPSGPTRVGLGLPVLLSIRVANQGNGTAQGNATLAFFNETMPGAPFASFVVAILGSFEISMPFSASWTSPQAVGTYRLLADVDYGDDLVEWNEANNRYTWTVEVVAGPVTSLVIGMPNVTARQTYITSATPLSFAVFDQGGTGIRSTTYRANAGPWINYTATGPFTLAAEGSHLVEWFSEDFAGNVEALANATLVVDDTAPSVAVDVGWPKYAGAKLFVTSATPVSLSASDGGVDPVGLASLEYRVRTGPWAAYASPFTVSGPDGAAAVEVRATDFLGNAATDTADVVVDNTPPVTAPSRGDGAYPPGIEFAFSPTDAGSGVARTEVRVDGGPWTTYAAPLVLPEGDHTVAFRSVDNVNNTEAERIMSVTIGGTSLPPETNWKPLVAAVFAAVLSVVGVWSARRVPSRTRSRPRAWAFVRASLPFVALEAGTGVVSLLTGILAIPPLLGTGTAVDVALLGVGIGVSAYRVRKWTPR